MSERTHTFEIGEFQGAVIFDFTQPHTAEELIVDPDIDELNMITREYHFTLPEIQVGYNNLLLRSPDQIILIDAGIQEPIGELSIGLEELDILPTDIDTIVITHTDKDHIGGIVGGETAIIYSNARYVLLKDTWQFWSSAAGRREITRLNQWPENKTDFIWEILSRVKDSIHPVESGEEFAPGLKLFPAAGHRYDHSILVLSSLQEKLIHLSDAVVHPLFMSNRKWSSTYDSDPAQAIETRNSLLDKCVRENALVFASHFPLPGLGFVDQKQDHWIWKPISNP